MTGARNGDHRPGGVFIDVPTSIFGTHRRNARDARKRRQIQEMLDEKDRGLSHLYSVKLQPSHVPDLSDTRPLPRSCQICFPQAEMVILEEMRQLGLLDCFVPPTMSSYNSVFCRAFPFYTYYGRRINNSQLNKLPAWKELEKDPNLFKLYEEEFARDPTTAGQKKQEVLQVLDQLQVSYVGNYFRTYFMRLSAWFCQKFLSHHFESVLVHGGQLELLKDVHAKKLPVIYVPTYRSSFDKAIIMWVLAHYGFRIPLFIRDHKFKNSYLKYFGGIGASLQVGAGPDSERKYSSALAVYFQHLIRNGNCVMLNLESGRTRSGRPSPSIYGTEFLKLIYDEFENKKIEDAYIVPVSVSYELLPDGKEIFENLKPASRGILSYFTEFLKGLIFPSGNAKGKVKIDFAQPISFRELLKSLQKNVKVKILTTMPGEYDSYALSRNCSYLRWGSTESLNSVSSLYGEMGLLYPDADANQTLKFEAVLLDTMNFHLLYDAGRCESVMPTHLVAFILMKKFRKGIHLDQLKKELEWLINIMRTNKKDFGFYLIDADMESIAFRAVELLKDDIICEWVEDKQTYKFQVRQELSSLRKLDYYANYLLPDFMLEGIIATAIFGMKGASVISVLRGFDAEVRIKEHEFYAHCERVYNVLRGTFFLHTPCMRAESARRQQVAKMADTGRLTLIMREARKYAWEYEANDDFDEYYGAPTEANELINDPNCPAAPEEVAITTSEETIDHLTFYRSLVIPYFDIFAFLVPCLQIILEADGERIDTVKLEKHLLQKLMEEVHNELQYCRELCTRSTVKQFLATCEDNGILAMESTDGKMDRFYTSLKSGAELQMISNDILFYVTV